MGITNQEEILVISGFRVNAIKVLTQLTGDLGVVREVDEPLILPLIISIHPIIMLLSASLTDFCRAPDHSLNINVDIWYQPCA